MIDKWSVVVGEEDAEKRSKVPEKRADVISESQEQTGRYVCDCRNICRENIIPFLKCVKAAGLLRFDSKVGMARSSWAMGTSC